MSELKPKIIMGGDGLYAGIDEDDAMEINEPCMLIVLPNKGDFIKMNNILENWNTRTQTPWISVADDFPKAYEEVYIWPRPDYGYECFTGIYDKNYQCWIAESHNDYGSERHKVNVTHWANLPITPKEQGQ